MGLFKKPGRKAWYYRCRVHGRLWTRSTGSANRAEAELAIARLRRLAELHKQPLNAAWRLGQAIVQEIERIGLDISPGEATRAAEREPGYNMRLLRQHGYPPAKQTGRRP